MGSDRIGFVGVGLMGHGMAKNIVEKGFALTVLAHRNREPVDDLVRRGAQGGGEPGRSGGKERHRRDLRHRQPPGGGDPDRSGRPCLVRAGA